MTKRQMLREARSIIVGDHAHTNILIWKEGRSWKVATNLNKFSEEDVNEINGFQLSHCYNSMTLAEVEQDLVENGHIQN